MNLLKKIKSEKDNTIKYVFKTIDDLIVEFSKIDKEPDKFHICASTHTWCDMGCKFCHLTHKKVQKTRELKYSELSQAIDIIILDNSELVSSAERLLISFMGSGEPLNITPKTLIDIAQEVRYKYQDNFTTIRFSISTMVPKYKLLDLMNLAKDFYNSKLDFKIHYSLHSTNKEDREYLMPNCLNHYYVIPILHYLQETYDTKIELHYTLIKNLNDFTNSFGIPYEIEVLKSYGLPIKFLKFAEVDNMQSVSYEEYLEYVKPYFKDSECEYYEPPGSDIGASCGQFTMEEYIK